MTDSRLSLRTDRAIAIWMRINERLTEDLRQMQNARVHMEGVYDPSEERAA